MDGALRRDYTAFMRCDAGDDWLPLVEGQVSSWLREKGMDLSLAGHGDLALRRARVSVRRTDNTRARDLMLSIHEDGGRSGTWVTELIAHDEPGAQDWVHLTVANGRGQFVPVPRIARYLMQVLPLRDGRSSWWTDLRCSVTPTSTA